MSEGFTVRGFLVAADDKTRNARLKFNEVDWVDFLDEQFPLGGEVYISAKNTAAAVRELRETVKAREEEIARLKSQLDDIGKWHAVNPSLDSALNEGDGSYKP